METNEELIPRVPDLPSTAELIGVVEKLKLVLPTLLQKAAKDKHGPLILTSLDKIRDGLLANAVICPAIDQRLDKLESIIADNRQTPTYASKVTQPKIDKLLIIKAKEDKIEQTVIDKVKKLIRDDTDLQVDTLAVTERSIKIKSSNAKTIKKIKEMMDAEEASIESFEAKKLDPQIQITINSSEIENEKTFIKRNGLHEDQMCKFVIATNYQNYNKMDKTRIVIRLSRENRQIIEQNGRVFMGGFSVRFTDSFYIKSCNNCFNIGHTKKQCSTEKVCSNCTDSHGDTHCEKEKQEKGCLYCLNKYNKVMRHKPKSIDCSSYQEEIARQKNMTNWSYEF